LNVCYALNKNHYSKTIRIFATSMYKYILLFLILSVFSFCQNNAPKKFNTMENQKINKTEEEWKKIVEERLRERKLLEKQKSLPYAYLEN